MSLRKERSADRSTIRALSMTCLGVEAPVEELHDVEADPEERAAYAALHARITALSITGLGTGAANLPGGAS